ncbi:putative biofilm-associated protein [Staphylococcus gallinarum]|uniref:Putative biofilm-associated protein n=1 Tax=Staphylococcus gallinarum TaxID=1293 RepID=A0A380FMF5_STAGA|nr:putative biofilm-associated protein [Staphylococcus gallinarum]
MIKGNYTINLPSNKKFQGGESIKVTSTDASGNKSGETVIAVKRYNTTSGTNGE